MQCVRGTGSARMSAARNDRRMLRKLLAGLKCGACDGPVDTHAHLALWIDDHGRAHPHVVCSKCWKEGQQSESAVDELASKCALNLTPAGGRA